MHYLKKAPFVIYFAALICCTSNRTSNHTNTIKKQLPSKNIDRWIFGSVNGSVLKFKNGNEFDTKLFDLKYIAKISNGDSPPYLIFSGRSCDECDANSSIYFRSPAEKSFDAEINKYQLPGTERDLEDNSLLYKARAFYGQVLPGCKGIIWYQQQLMDDKTFQKNIFIAKLSKGLVTDTVIKDNGQIKLTLQLLKQGLCSEIKGTNYSSEP